LLRTIVSSVFAEKDATIFSPLFDELASVMEKGLRTDLGVNSFLRKMI